MHKFRCSHFPGKSCFQNWFSLEYHISCCQYNTQNFCWNSIVVVQQIEKPHWYTAWYYYCSKCLQWFSFENQQSPVYVVNWHFSRCPDRCWKWFYPVFKLGANRYGLGLSNEPLFIIIAQGVAKLWPVKVGSLKKILLRGLLECGPESSPGFFSDLQLW